MTRITITSLLLALAGAAVIPASASAQCTGTELFCASASVHVGGTFNYRPPPPRRAQVIVVTPAPPPPPPVVVVHPAPPPPPVVVVQPAPPPVYVAPAPVVHVQAQSYAPPPRRRHLGWGLHGRLGGTVSSNVSMGGMTGALRLRPRQAHLAIDLGVGGYAGEDYNGLDRVEVPLTADALLFANPRDRLQLYGVAGLGFSFAHAEGFNVHTDEFESRDYAYFGGQLGVGLEYRINDFFAINGDLRGFMRTRIDDDERPEFVETDSSGEQRTTDTSGGMTANLGATLYF